MARLFDDASSQYLEIDQVPLTNHPITMAAWVRSDDADSHQVAVGLYDRFSNSRYVVIALGGTVGGDPVRYFVRGTKSSQALSTTTGYSVNTWHHICGRTVSQSDHAVFIDGGSKGTGGGNVGNFENNRTSIGREGDSSPGSYFSGRIAEVVIWDIALSDSEILYLARRISPLNMRPANIVAYWSLKGIASPEVDWSGNGRNIAVFGPIAADHAPIAPLLLSGEYRRLIAAAGETFYETITAIQAGVATIAQKKVFKTITATQIGAASLAKQVSKTIAATALGVAALIKKMFVTVAATQIGVATVSAVKLILQSIAATAVGVAVVSTVFTAYRTITATAVGAATLAKKVSKTIAATVVAVPGLARQTSKTISAAAVGVAVLAKEVGKTIVATAICVAVISTIATFLRTISAVAVGIASVAELFIPGAALSAWYWIRRRLRGE